MSGLLPFRLIRSISPVSGDGLDQPEAVGLDRRRIEGTMGPRRATARNIAWVQGTVPWDLHSYTGLPMRDCGSGSNLPGLCQA